MLKAVLFDMDGVIVDTEPQHLRAMIQAGALYGVTLTEDYCKQFIGLNNHDTITRLSSDHPELDIQKFQESFVIQKNKVKDEEGLIPIEGTLSLLRSLPTHGVTVAIASSSSPAEIERVVTTLGLSDYVDQIISGSMVKHSKPEPDIFLLAASKLGVDPSECIIIEDSKNGSIAAERAGIPCIGYQNVNSGNQDLSRTCCIYEDMAALDYDGVLEEYNRYHGYPVTILDTKRLTIRELAVSDMDALYSIYQGNGITDYIPKLSSLEEEKEKHEAYIKHVYNFYRFGLWGIFTKDQNELIGRAGLQCVDLGDTCEIELAYLIGQDWQQKGYAYECTNAIIELVKEYYDFPSLVALIHPDNKASLALAKKLGFVYETDVDHEGFTCQLYRLQLS